MAMEKVMLEGTDRSGQRRQHGNQIKNRSPGKTVSKKFIVIIVAK